MYDELKPAPGVGYPEWLDVIETYTDEDISEYIPQDGN